MWQVPPAPRFHPDDREDPDGADLTWAYPWPAGLALARHLASLTDCRDRRVADLGCGCGHAGAAALLGGARMVAFCDGSARALDQVRAAIHDNGVGTRATVHLHRWGTPVPDGPYELILGGDLLYRSAFIPGLCATIAASLAPAGLALLSDGRHQEDPEVAARAGACGLTASWCHHNGYGLYRLHRRTNGCID